MLNKKTIKSFSFLVLGFLGFSQFDCTNLQNNPTNQTLNIDNIAQEIFSGNRAALPGPIFELLTEDLGFSSPRAKINDKENVPTAPHALKDAREFVVFNTPLITSKLNSLVYEDGTIISQSLRGEILNILRNNNLAAKKFAVANRFETRDFLIIGNVVILRDNSDDDSDSVIRTLNFETFGNERYNSEQTLNQLRNLPLPF